MRFIYFTLILLLSYTVTLAQDRAAESVFSFEISLDSVDWPVEKSLDTIDITLRSFGELGGFNFRIASIVGSVDIVDIVRGDLPTDCRWEFFSSRWQGEQEFGDRLLNVWTVVALPRLIPDSTEKEGPCFSLPGEPTLARVVITAGQSRYGSEDFSPLFFLWDDCGDNAISSVRGDLLYMSDSVFWPSEVQGMPTTREFPSVAGSPDHCISEKAADRIKRTIRFTNGGVRFTFDL